MEHFQVFKDEFLTAVHRAGVLRFEYELVGVTVVGTIKEHDSVEGSDWNVDLIPMKLIYVDAFDMETESLEALPDGAAKRDLIENSMWLIGDKLAGWFADGEMAMSLKETKLAG